jgi:lysozyme family protein
MTDAAQRFDGCLKAVLAQEGGYVDNPLDPGGATNLGITRKTLAAWRKITPWTALEKSEVKAFGSAEAAQIYKSLYWDRCSGDALPAGIDLMVFDFAVNSGPDRTIKTLQGLLKVGADGIVGPMTLAAIAARSAKTAELIDGLATVRLGFLQQLNNFVTFGSGWNKRVAVIRTTAFAMAGVTAPVSPKVQTSTPKRITAMDFLSGYKTYIVGFIMLLAGVCQLLGVPLPALDGHSAGQLLMEGAAIVFLHKGIKTDTSSS